MIIRDPSLTFTPALAAWLRGAHDDGQPDLLVRAIVGDPTAALRITRADYSDLSPAEEREVRALLAAHAAEPLTMPSK
jgi:hypothetical protein